MSVLIVTMPGDVHAHAVKWAIEKIGGSVQLVYPADLCNGARWTFDPSVSALSIEYETRAQDIDFAQYDSVWMRRPPAALPQEHLEDRVERAVSEDDFGTLSHSMYLLIENGRFTVNRVDNSRKAGLKPFQLAMAAEVGLSVPRTLIGNSPERILEFYEACGGDIVFKPFHSPLWQTQKGPKMVPTTRVTREILERSNLATAPGIFQQHVRKCAEIRATIMGRSVFAWKKQFDGREDLDVDWRFMFKNAIHSPHKLPGKVEAACFSLMERLGIVFGCFDFIIDDADDYFFLEVNPQGQWLWGDSLNVGLIQLEGMAEFLLSRSPRFQYSGRDVIRWSDCPRDMLAALAKAEKEHHYGHLMTFMYYQESFKMNSVEPN